MRHCLFIVIGTIFHLQFVWKDEVYHADRRVMLHDCLIARMYTIEPAATSLLARYEDVGTPAYRTAKNFYLDHRGMIDATPVDSPRRATVDGEACGAWRHDLLK